MSNLLNTASLVVTPNSYKEGTLFSVIPNTGAGDMTVVRATTATRVNSAGLVELVPYNLVTYSNDISNSDWGKISGSGGTNPIVTSNYATSPSGLNDASRIQLARTSASGSYSTIRQAITITPNTNYTQSVWLKSLSGTPSILIADNGATYLNLITLTTDWVRYELPFSNGSNFCNFDFALSQGVAGSSLSADFLVYGAQLVEGTLPKDYQKTETRLNIPRLDYSNGTCPSLLVEPQRTNLVTYSEEFDNVSWLNQAGSSITANQIISPDGTQNADKLNVIVAAYSYIFKIVLAGSNIYTTSIYAKKGTKDYLFILNTTGAGARAWFNLNTGTLGTVASGYTATITDAGNGWYRCTMTNNTAELGTYVGFGFVDADNTVSPTSTGYGYLYGSQLEAGSYPTSYIPTTSASVTRNGDSVSKTGISSLIGQTEGTVFIDITINSVANTDLILVGNSTGTVYDIYMFTGGNKIIAAIVNNGSYVWSQGATFDFVVGVKYKCAIGYKSGSIVFYINGIQIGSSSSTFVPFAIANKVQLAEYLYSGKQSVSFQSVSIFTTRLTNDQLAQLTTI